MSFVDTDVNSFFRGLDEVPVVYGGVTVKGHFNAPQTPFDVGPAGSVESQRYSVDIAANAFSPLPAARTSIVVNGTTYKIESRKLSEDGRICTVNLGR